MTRRAAAAVLVVLLAQSAAWAGPGDVANDIADEVMSPFCDGVTLHDCPSEEAAALRDRIERWARRGWEKSRIVDRLQQEYGPGIAAAPPAEGAGLLAWALPALAVVAGGYAAWALARRWTGGRTEDPLSPDPGPPGPTGGPDISEAERRRLDAELRALRAEP